MSYVLPLLEHFIRTQAHSLNRSFTKWFLSSLYIQEINHLKDILSHSVCFLFAQLIVYSAVQKPLSFMKSYLSIVVINYCTNVVLLRKSFPTSISGTVYVFSKKFQFEVSHLCV